MRFSPAFLDDIKARIPVSQVVRRHVKLSKAGKEWKGLSPFSPEKTPSFFVNDQKRAWFDFSSGKNGNIFDFLVLKEGLSFTEAVTRLAHEAGLPLPVFTQEQAQKETHRLDLYQVMEEALSFFEAQLRGQQGGRARKYAEGRGLSDEEFRQFRLGYAPADRFALKNYLAAKGVATELQIEAGLLIHGPDISVPYDRFRDRLIFPICDQKGRPIAFGGRALDPQVPAKYLNSPETDLFHKGSILYNYHRARQAAHEKGYVIAVEGYVDVVAMTRAGFPHVVAPMGTALTQDQCFLLWSLCQEPLLCFDGDRAGQKAAYRALDVVLPLITSERTLKCAFLPDGKDPDDLVRTEGAHAVQAILDSAKPLVDVLWDQEFLMSPLETPEQRAGFEHRIYERVRSIGDDILKRYYLDEIKTRLAALRGTAQRQHYRQGGYEQEDYGRVQRSSQSWSPRRAPHYGRDPFPKASLDLTKSLGASLPQREGLILLLFLTYPDLLIEHAEELATLVVEHPELDHLRHVLLGALGEEHVESSHIYRHLQQEGLLDLAERLEKRIKAISPFLFREDALREDISSSLEQAMALHRHMCTLRQDLRAAEHALVQDFSSPNIKRLHDIKQELLILEQHSPPSSS